MAANQEHPNGVAADTVSAVPAAEKCARLSLVALRQSAQDLDAFIRTLPRERQQYLLDIVGLQLDPRFMRGGAGRGLRRTYSGLSEERALRLAYALSVPLIDAIDELEHYWSDDIAGLVDAY